MQILLYLYCFIACYFLVCFATGKLQLGVSKEGEEIKLNNKKYGLLCILFSIGWIYLICIMKNKEE